MGVVLTVAALSSAFIPGFEDLLRGDANNDSVVNTADPVFISSYLYQGGNAPPCKDAADANDDGQIDNSDTVYLYHFLFMGGPQPPSPYPYCGQDPTGDSLDCQNSACN